MIFWVEDGIEISYEQFLNDIRESKSYPKHLGYNYFVSLLVNLLKGTTTDSIEDLISYLINNKDHLVFQIQTSGTTSTPKSVDVKMSNCIRHVKMSDEDLKRVWAMCYPVGSFASTQVFFQALMNKETIVYFFGIDFKSSDLLFSSYNISNLSCTPTFLSMLLINIKNSYSSVRKITTGGEKMKDNLILSFKKTFTNADYVNIYASTETGSLLYSNTEYFTIPQKYKSLIKIEDGTLRVHKSLLNEVNQNVLEWFDTNDLVEFIDDNQFKFVSRANGYLNTGGFRVSPTEIEEYILSINGVVDVHVYGKSNSLLGTIICADVIGNDISIKMIKTELMELTEKYKVPQVIRVVDSFEYVSNGKKKLMI
jgi:acyl-coenzyme A synthetase/AMP-(fatty) acid ligase